MLWAPPERRALKVRHPGPRSDGEMNMRRMFSLCALVVMSVVGVAAASTENLLPVREGASIPAPQAPRAQPPLDITGGKLLPVGDGSMPVARPEPAPHAVESTVGQLPVDEAAGSGRQSSDKSGAAPQVMDDHFTVQAGSTLAIAAAAGFLVNDYDPEGDAVIATAISHFVDNGSLSAFTDGSFNYTPVAGFTGYDYFDYQVTDGTNNAEIGRVHFHVVATDRPPLALGEAYAVAMNAPLAIAAAAGFLVNDFDPDGDAVAAITIPDDVDYGTLSAYTDGQFTYTPNPNFTGTDSFSYQISANGLSAIATVTLTVYEPNRAPIATADYYYAPISGSIAVPVAAGLFRNDLDPDGDVFFATIISDLVDYGTLLAYTDGHFSYTPTPGYSGIDRFTYQIGDVNGASASATVTIFVGVTSDPASPVPLPPADGQRFGMSLPTPNPFNPTTRIDFRVDGTARTAMRVFDLRGALVRTLVDEDLPAGDHTVQWDGRDDQGVEMASGAYFVALVSGSDLTSRKIALVK